MAHDLYGGYTREQLTEAFDLVQPPDNWKNPIDASVPVGTDLKVLDAAVTFFTGSTTEFFPQPDGSTRVIAEGYYASIGS